MKSNVFNNTIFDKSELHYPQLTEAEERQILSEIFEQLLIFDKITIATNRVNSTLLVLYKLLGLYTLERMLESGFIEFMLWSPIIVTSTGRQLEDGTFDESVIYGKPPIAAGEYSKLDLDPEYNIDKALSKVFMRLDLKRGLKKKLIKNYIVLDGMSFSRDAEVLVIDSYKKNNLSNLDLPYLKEPEQLNAAERRKLLNLGNKVIETAVLSKYLLKSYENYEHYSICSQNLENIGKAYNVAGNTSEILKVENLPNLKSMFLQERMDFNNVFKIRYLSCAKYYRKWINKVGENANAQEIASEYLKEIQGKYKFYQTGTGKLFRNIGVFGITTELGNAIAGMPGVAVGFGLGLLDTFWLEGILKGKNPSMFIENIKKEMNTNNAANI